MSNRYLQVGRAPGVHKAAHCKQGIFDICFGKTNAREAGEGPGGSKRPSWGRGRL